VTQPAHGARDMTVEDEAPAVSCLQKPQDLALEGAFFPAERDGHSKPAGAFQSGRWTRRWKIKRLFAWLGAFHRLVVRFERHALDYLSFVPLDCIVMLFRQGRLT
jgi:hypothetical protein